MFLLSNKVVVFDVMMFLKYFLNSIPQLMETPFGKPGTNTVFPPTTRETKNNFTVDFQNVAKKKKEQTNI